MIFTDMPLACIDIYLVQLKDRAWQISRIYTLDRKVKNFIFNVFLKKLSTDVKIDDRPASLEGYMWDNFKLSNGKLNLVTYHWRGLFETKILIKVVLALDDY